MLPKFEYVRAGSLDQAMEYLSSPDARIHAGGTDLLGCLRSGVFGISRMVSLNRVEEMRGIETTTDGSLRIGALTTLAQVAGDAAVRERYPALARAASEVASPQLRNQGTLGGNLCQRPRCWYFRGEFHCAKKGGEECFAVTGENRYHAILGGGPCFIVHPSDTAVALTALNAALRIRGADGERTVPIESFYALPDRDITRETILEPGEIVTEILLPAPGKGERSLFRKVRERGAWDFALASIAVSLRFSGERVTGARVVLGGVAPVPWRTKQVEEVIVAEGLGAGAIEKAAIAAVRGTEPLAWNGYKVELVKGIVRESLQASGRQ